MCSLASVAMGAEVVGTEALVHHLEARAAGTTATRQDGA